MAIGVVATLAGITPSWLVCVPFERCSESVSNSNFLYCGPAFSVTVSATSHSSSNEAVRNSFTELCGRRRICDSVHAAGSATLTLPYVITGKRLLPRKSKL